MLIKREELHFINLKREIYTKKIEKWRDIERERDRDRERERERERAISTLCGIRMRELFPLYVVLGFRGLEVYWLILVTGIRGCEIRDGGFWFFSLATFSLVKEVPLLCSNMILDELILPLPNGIQ